MDFNHQIIEEFRAGQGRVGGPFQDARLLLLTTTGARTGAVRTVPLGYLHDESGRLLVIASAAGAPRHPAWYHNLRANPRVTVETGVSTFRAEAVVLDGAERDLSFARAVQADPGWAEYQTKTDRVLPVVALVPVEGAEHRMDVNDVPAPPGEGDAVRGQFPVLFGDPPALDADADLTPVLPDTGGVAGTWVTAGHLHARDVTEQGVTVYVHGGGFEYSNPTLERVMAYRFAQATGRPVFAVDYRLAPAHPFPAAVDDVVACYLSLLDQGVPAERVLFAGESAGGTLVLSALLVLAAAGAPLPAGAAPVSPVTDFAETSTAGRVDHGRDVIDPTVMGPVAEQYLGDAPRDQAPQSPIHGDLAGLPPLLLTVGADEVLLDDVRRFGEAAAAAGTEVTLDVYQDMPHAFHAAALAPDQEQLPTAKTFLTRLTTWSERTG